jgi:hypothetical protein
LSDLDSIVMHLFGRSEDAKQSDFLFNAVGTKAYANTIDVVAPAYDGTYDVAYFSFAGQRVIFYGDPVTVHSPSARVQPRRWQQAAALPVDPALQLWTSRSGLRDK